jgi:hypothetical protein
MGSDKIRYLVYAKGRWRWQPTKAMRKHGFQTIKLSRGGPEIDPAGRPRPTNEDKTKAVAMNSEWDSARLGLPSQKLTGASARYPTGSVGDGFLSRHGDPQSRKSPSWRRLDDRADQER